MGGGGTSGGIQAVTQKCRECRSLSRSPICFVCNRTQVSDGVAGLSAASHSHALTV